MILPTKHIRSERALLSVGGEILRYLRDPTTVSRLWDEVRGGFSDGAELKPITYDWFILALDLLYMMGAIDIERGLIRKTTR